MRKILFLTLLTLVFAQNTNADTIIVMDDNNVVKQQIYTLPNSTVQTIQTVPAAQTQPIYVSSAPLPPQQVIVTPPVQPVVVVRETPAPRNYYYDSTETAAVAGFTGALVGGLIYSRADHPRHRRHHHHCR